MVIVNFTVEKTQFATTAAMVLSGYFAVTRR